MIGTASLKTFENRFKSYQKSLFLLSTGSKVLLPKQETKASLEKKLLKTALTAERQLSEKLRNEDFPSMQTLASILNTLKYSRMLMAFGKIDQEVYDVFNKMILDLETFLRSVCGMKHVDDPRQLIVEAKNWDATEKILDAEALQRLENRSEEDRTTISVDTFWATVNGGKG